MEEIKQKKGFKEFCRKFIVSLKKRTYRIPQFMMVIAFIFYSVCLSQISNATAYVNKTPMGLCSFVTMLLSVLAFVCSLNAFPARGKPKIFMVILMYLMEVIVIGADVWYAIKINEGLSTTEYQAKALATIYNAQTVITIHYILVTVTIVLFLLVPLMRKALYKINTSVELNDNKDMKKIELEDE